MINVAKILRPYAVRESSALTASYVAGEEIDAKDCNTLVLYIDYVGNNLTSADIRISFSYDGTTPSYHQESMTAAALGITTEYQNVRRFTSDGSYRIIIPLLDRFVKIEAIGNGVGTGSSMTIDGYVGVSF